MYANAGASVLSLNQQTYEVRSKREGWRWGIYGYLTRKYLLKQDVGRVKS